MLDRLIRTVRNKVSDIIIPINVIVPVLLLSVLLIVPSVCISALETKLPDEDGAGRYGKANSEIEFEDTDSDSDERVNVTVVVGGKEFARSNSPLMSVAGLLNELHVDYDSNTTLNYSKNTEIFDGMTITLGKYTTELYSEITDIPYGTQYVEVQTIPKDSTVPVSGGVNGRAIVTHEITFIDGVAFADNVICTEVVKEPEDAVFYLGVGGTVEGEDGTSYNYSYYLDVTATAYKTGGRTATGKEATDGIIAVDPDVIPYGTKVFITGNYGEIGCCSAEDTGGFIRGNRIDICMSGTLQDLLNFGRRTMRVYILA